MATDFDAMDRAAEKAIEELQAKMAKDPNLEKYVREVADWIADHYEEAGYKRLIRGLWKIV